MTPPIVRWRRDAEIPELPSATTLRELLHLGYHPQAHSWLLHLNADKVEGSLRTLAKYGCLEWVAGDFVARPIATSATYLEEAEGNSERQLSRFTFLQPLEDQWMLQSARSPWYVVMSGEGVGRLSRGDLTAEEWDLLARCMMTTTAESTAESSRWAFHDRLFADRSRSDFRVSPSDMQVGLVRSPDPIVDRFPQSKAIRLPAPSMPDSNEPSLWEAMESRRTPHPLPEHSLTLDQLSELLYRTLRVVHSEPAAAGDPRSYVRRWRPVPSGGALHGIETWVGAKSVLGVDPGWYWYRASDHCLVQLPRGLESSLEDQPAPATLLFTVNHDRTAWKYSDISLALELKDLGVILYAMQLAGEALDLAVQPRGSGSTRSFTELLGIDPEIDCPIGEMWVASRGRED